MILRLVKIIEKQLFKLMYRIKDVMRSFFSQLRRKNQTLWYFRSLKTPKVLFHSKEIGYYFTKLFLKKKRICIDSVKKRTEKISQIFHKDSTSVLHRALTLTRGTNALIITPRKIIIQTYNPLPSKQKITLFKKRFFYFIKNISYFTHTTVQLFKKDISFIRHLPLLTARAVGRLCIMIGEKIVFFGIILALLEIFFLIKTLISSGKKITLYTLKGSFHLSTLHFLAFLLIIEKTLKMTLADLEKSISTIQTLMRKIYYFLKAIKKNFQPLLKRIFLFPLAFFSYFRIVYKNTTQDLQTLYSLNIKVLSFLWSVIYTTLEDFYTILSSVRHIIPVSHSVIIQSPTHISHSLISLCTDSVKHIFYPFLFLFEKMGDYFYHTIDSLSELFLITKKQYELIPATLFMLNKSMNAQTRSSSFQSYSQNFPPQKNDTSSRFSFFKKHYLTESLILAVVLGTVGVFMSLYAAPTRSSFPVAYQGKLMDQNYVPKADTSYFLAFEIYDASSGGTCKWRTETGGTGLCDGSALRAISVTTNRGLFTALLGNAASNNPAIGEDFNTASTAYYLQVRVCTDANAGSCETLTPRKQLGGVALAYNSDMLDGLSSAAFGILAGQSGGQTLKGDTASGGNLTLMSTAHATKGKILFGASGYDEVNDRLGIGTATPATQLDVTKASIGVTQADTYGVVLINTTAAAADAQQYSPPLRWRGFGWKTDATAASQSVDFRSYVIPVQGTANPTGYLTFENSINGAAYTTLLTLNSSGKIGIGSTSPDSLLEISNSAVNASQPILMISNETGTTTLDPLLQFRTGASPSVNWTLGNDDSDNDKFLIGTTGLNTNTVITLDSRTTTDGVSTMLFGGIAPTLSATSTSEYTTLTVTPPTITYTGTTQVTSQMDSILLNAPTITNSSSNTVDAAATLTIAGAPVKAGSVTLSNTYGLKINAAAVSTATNGYGLYVSAPTGATNNYGGVIASGRFGIGDTSPDALLDVDYTSTSTTASIDYASYILLSDTGVVTSGTDDSYGTYIDITRTGATGGALTTYGIRINLATDNAGSGTHTAYGIRSTLDGNADTNYGIYSTVAAAASQTAYGLYVDAGTGAGTEYAAIFTNGNVGIGNTAPATLLTLGTAGTTAGTLSMAGSTSGVVTLNVAAAAGTWTLTLPTNDGDSGQFLQTNGSGTTSWAYPNLTVVSTTNFENSTRFTTAATNGTATFNSSGVTLATTAASTSYIKLLWAVNSTPAGTKLYSASPVFSTRVAWKTAAASTGSAFAGIGTVTTAGTGHTWTNNHIGFIFIGNGSSTSVYASQADGSTENRSSALTTVDSNDVLDFIVKVNSTTSVDYYWRKNAGSLSSATNLTSNLPTANEDSIQFSSANDSTATNFTFDLGSASYER